MAEKNIGNDVKKKGLELKKLFDELDAKIEQWKFSVENTKEGMRVELHAVALLKQSKNKK
jgi:hypothetical protein